MTIRFSTTRQEAKLTGVKVLCHGRAGAGKTPLCATAPAPLIISAEAGLLSLKDYDIPVIVVNSLDDLDKAYQYVAYDPWPKQNIQTVCLDSISEVAEVCLATQKRVKKDPRQAYGDMQDMMLDRIRWFRDLPGYNVYFSAKQSWVKDEVTGIMLYGPSMPGQKVGPAMPYLFDEVFSLEVAIDAVNGGKPFNYLRTQRGPQHEARDRSGMLDPFEKPDLTHIFNKIRGGDAIASLPASTNQTGMTA